MKRLSPAEQKFKDYLSRHNIKPFSAITKEELEKETALFQEWAGESVLPFKELTVKARDGFPVRVRIFNPDVHGDTFFYLPGNGYCVAHLFEPNTVIASRIAKAWQHRVVFVDFRLMPPSQWPTPVEDVQDVINAFIHNSTIPGINPKSIILGGFSGGAHASVLLALDQHRGFEIKKLVLIGGSYDFSFSQTAFAEYEALDYICKRSNLQDLLRVWGLADQNLKDPKYSPLFANNFKSLPPTVIIVGEFDGVRSDSEILYEKLKNNGVTVTKIVLPGQTHNNIEFNKMCGDENDAALVCAKVLVD